MVDDATRPGSGDQRDDLAAALDFSVAGGKSEASDLDALDFDAAAAFEVQDLSGPLFTVTNPDGSVTVTAYPDGRVKQIELSRKAGDMTEADLADEIVVIAGLASQDARSAQYAFMLDGMRRQGHDDAATRDFLTRDLALPTPEQARAERADVFAARYAGGHD